MEGVTRTFVRWDGDIGVFREVFDLKNPKCPALVLTGGKREDDAVTAEREIRVPRTVAQQMILDELTALSQALGLY